MPLYEYRCSRCGRIEDHLDPMEKAPIHRCEKCRLDMDRIVSVFSAASKSSAPDGCGDCDGGSRRSQGSCPRR